MMDRGDAILGVLLNVCRTTSYCGRAGTHFTSRMSPKNKIRNRSKHRSGWTHRVGRAGRWQDPRSFFELIVHAFGDFKDMDRGGAYRNRKVHAFEGFFYQRMRSVDSKHHWYTMCDKSAHLEPPSWDSDRYATH